MSDIEAARRALVARIVDVDGDANQELRRAAFDAGAMNASVRTLVDKVASHAHDVSDADVAAARAAGMSEDQIFEVVVCAAVGRATRQHEQALSALRAATKGG